MQTDGHERVSDRPGRRGGRWRPHPVSSSSARNGRAALAAAAKGLVETSMPAATNDISQRVHRTIARAERLARHLPGQLAHLLFRDVALVQTGEADFALGHYLAATGAEIVLLTPKAAAWSDERDGPLYRELAEAVAARSPRLHDALLRSITAANARMMARFECVEAADPAEWVRRVKFAPCYTVLMDGMAELLAAPAAVLRGLHALTAPGGLVEILARPGEHCTTVRLDALRREAVALGFGVHHYALELAEGRGHAEAEGASLGLIRLTTPMTDTPMTGREGPQVMAHCLARLDVACRLVSDAEVLDAGGGTGIGARRYLREGGARRVVNLDVSAEALTLARQAADADGLGEDRLRCVRWDLNTAPLPFDDASFDVVICLEALEHITGQAGAVAEFHRVLRPGGVLLVSVPGFDFEAQWARINRYENPFHLHVPRREEFAELLQGFEIARWLRQCDVLGSMVFDEDAAASLEGGFSTQAGWSPKAGMAQVIAAVCVKPGAEPRVDVRSDPSLHSRLRVWENSASTVLALRTRLLELEAQAVLGRYHWWGQANEARDALVEARKRHAALEQRLAESEAARGQAEGKARASADLLATNLRELGAALADLQQRLAHTQQDRDAARDAAVAAAREREAFLAERGRWQAERHALLDLLGEAGPAALERLERRCLALESRLYDLEDGGAAAPSRTYAGVVIPAAAASSNGTAAHAAREGQRA